MEVEYKISNNKTNILVNVDPEVMSNLGIWAAKIAYYNFQWRYVTLIIVNTIQAVALQTFLINYNQAVIIKLGRFTPRNRIQVHQFVIFGQESTEISNILRWVVKSKYDSTGKFIVVCHSSDYAECDETEVFKTLAELFILNVVYLKVSYNSDNFEAYSYEMILPDKCFNNEPKEIDLVTKCNKASIRNMFPEKIKSFHGCPLIVSTVELPPFINLINGTNPSGKDAEIIRLVANILNATLIVTTPSESECGYYENGNWSGSLGDVYHGYAHSSVCFAPLTSYKYEHFQISSPYFYIDTVWAARLPPLRPSWEKLLYPLSVHLRITLLFIFIGIVFMNIFARTTAWTKFRQVFKVKAPKRSYLFYSWILFLGMPIHSRPSKLSVRILIYTWIWFCFIVRSAYQAALITSLKLDAYRDYFETHKDVLNYPYGGALTLKSYYRDESEIYDNWITLRSSETCKTLHKILDGSTDFVLAINKETINHHLIQYNGTKQLQIVPEMIVSSPMVMYFRMYSPLTVPISNILVSAFESGFVQYSYRRNWKHDTYFLKRPKINGPQALTMNHFTGCFALLMVGWILAVIYFVVEVISSRKAKK